MKIDKTFVQIYRKFTKWEWYKDINTKVLFLHLILEANYKDKNWQGIKIKRGEKLTGRKALSSETGLTEQQVRTSLNRLKLTNEITIKTTSKYSIISVVNYDLYQLTNQLTNQQLTNKQPATNQQLTTNNKDNKDNKVKNKTYSIKCHDVVNYFFGFLSERESERFESSRNSFLDTADKLIRIDKYSVDEVNRAVKFAKSDPFWSGVFQSFIKLRNKNKDGIKFIEVFLSKTKSYDPKDKGQSLPDLDEEPMRNIGVDFQPGDAF